MRVREAADAASRTSHGRLVAVLASASGDLAAAEDAVAEAFVAALDRWPVTGVPANVEGWLYTVARNRLRDHFRSAARRRSVSLDAVADAAVLATVAGSAEPADDDPTTTIPDKRLALLLGAEGGHSINNSAGVLRMFARLGVRYVTLTHTSTTDWADSGTDVARHNGLSATGADFVREMNRLGVLVDLSHVSPTTAHDALDVSSTPVIFSHSSCLAVTDHPRNVPDDVLTRLAANGGVQMVTFVPMFLSRDYADWDEGGSVGTAPPVTVADAANHIEHARDVAGLDHIGLGGDFDGTPTFPTGLEDVAAYPRLLEELAGRGWSADELRKLSSGNILRVLADTDDAFARAGATRW